jgi:hypothetical protein
MKILQQNFPLDKYSKITYKRIMGDKSAGYKIKERTPTPLARVSLR